MDARAARDRRRQEEEDRKWREYAWQQEFDRRNADAAADEEYRQQMLQLSQQAGQRADAEFRLDAASGLAKSLQPQFQAFQQWRAMSRLTPEQRAAAETYQNILRATGGDEAAARSQAYPTQQGDAAAPLPSFEQLQGQYPGVDLTPEEYQRLSFERGILGRNTPETTRSAIMPPQEQRKAQQWLALEQYKQQQAIVDETRGLLARLKAEPRSDSALIAEIEKQLPEQEKEASRLMWQYAGVLGGGIAGSTTRGDPNLVETPAPAAPQQPVEAVQEPDVNSIIDAVSSEHPEWSDERVMNEVNRRLQGK